MSLEFRNIDKQDHKRAIDFAIRGMHFGIYFKAEDLAVGMYGKYFWYAELLKATQVIAAYDGEEFMGVLLADMKGEPRKYKSFSKWIYVKFIELIQRFFARGSAGAYDVASEKMRRKYNGRKLDGEIRFFAADPDKEGMGIGSALLEEFQRRESGKNIFLYTDDQCTYQFYEHRGFNRVGEENIMLELELGEVPLKCFMYQKNL